MTKGKSTDRDPESLLPLTPATLQILMSLVDGEQHGYAIMKEVEERQPVKRGASRSGNTVRIAQAAARRWHRRRGCRARRSGTRRRASPLLPDHQVRRGGGASRSAAARVGAAHGAAEKTHRMETGMSTDDRIYRLLLRAYPAEFRSEFGSEMALAFRDRRRDMRAMPVRFWLTTLLDVARSAPSLRLEASTGRPAGHVQFKEGTMKTMAIVATVVGLFIGLSASMEAWIGGVVNHDRFLACRMIVMGLVAGLFLAYASAIAALRRATRSGTDAFAARGYRVPRGVFSGLAVGDRCCRSPRRDWASYFRSCCCFSCGIAS